MNIIWSLIRHHLVASHLITNSVKSESLYIFNWDKIVIKGSQQETPDLGFVLLCTHQQGVPLILRGLMLPDGFDSISSRFTVRNITTELSASQMTSSRTEIYSWLIDHWLINNVMYIIFNYLKLKNIYKPFELPPKMTTMLLYRISLKSIDISLQFDNYII